MVKLQDNFVCLHPKYAEMQLMFFHRFRPIIDTKIWYISDSTSNSLQQFPIPVKTINNNER